MINAIYWFATGTPTFLINLLKIKQYPLQDFEQISARESELGQFEPESIDLKVLLFQTGYITIKSYDHKTRNYTLGYPNNETIDSLGELIITFMKNKNISEVEYKVYQQI